MCRIFFQDGHSYRTRMLSIRSTNGRSMYSARKSISLPLGETLKLSARNSFQSRNNQSRENEIESRKSDDFAIHNDEVYSNTRADKKISISRETKRMQTDIDEPIGDERVKFY